MTRRIGGPRSAVMVGSGGMEPCDKTALVGGEPQGPGIQDDERVRFRK
jgi:hypothetical protein